MFVFFFKQKTAYEMRIRYWSSDVCSSDLLNGKLAFTARSRGGSALAAALVGTVPARNMATAAARRIRRKARADPRYAISAKHKRCAAPGSPAWREAHNVFCEAGWSRRSKADRKSKRMNSSH